MSITEEELRAAIDDARENLQFSADLWVAGEIPIDGTNNRYASAKAFRKLGTGAVLLRAPTQARQWFGSGAHLRQEKISVRRLCRDKVSAGAWEGEPRAFTRALTDSLLSYDENQLTAIAADAVAMDDVYLDVFADDYPDAPAPYLEMKTRSALIFDDDRDGQFLAQLTDEAEMMPNSGEYWETVPTLYQAVIDEDKTAAETALESLVAYTEQTTPDPTEPHEFVLHTPAALTVLARRRGLDITPVTERVPDMLIDTGTPTDEITLDADVDDLKFTSDVGVFELEAGDSTPVIVARTYHPGGEPVTLADVSERPAGRLLSEEWVEAALAEAERRDAYDDALVAAATAAYGDGTLQPKLTAVYDRVDCETFDASLAELPGDDIEMLKRAGERVEG